MNSKQFITAFMAMTTIASVYGLGELTTVMMNGALTVPLISATAGSMGAALAVIGALKLGAVAVILASQIAANNLSESRRSKRAAAAASATSPDTLFNLISSMDTYNCGKQLVCELEAQNPRNLSADEILILSLFGDRKSKPINPASPKSEFDLAAQLGLASKNQVVCRQRYASCPFTADEMMQALRNANL